MKIKVDQDKCIGCGTCIALAAKSFNWNKDNKVDPVEPPGDDEETIKMAAEACPVTAITLEK